MNRFIYFLFLLGVFISPFITYLPFKINFTFFDFILSFCLILVIIMTTLTFNFQNKLYIGIAPKMLFLFFGASFVSLFHSNNIFNSINIMLQYGFMFITQIIVITYIFKLSININKIMLKIIDIFLYSLVLVLFIGILAYFQLLPFNSIFFTGNGRLNTAFGNPNSLAKYFVTAIPLVLLYIDLKRKLMFSYIVLAMIVFNLFLTASFGGIIYTIGVVIYYIIVKTIIINKPIKIINNDIYVSRKLASIRNVLLAFIVTFAIAFILKNPPKIFSERVLAADNLSESGSAEIKLQLMFESFDIISKNLFIGVGLGSYPSHSSFLINVHNLYLLILAEIGLIGFIGIFGLLLYIFVESFKLIKNNGHTTKFILLGLNSSLFGFLISITTSTHQYSRTTWILVILLLCYIEAIKINNKKKQIYEKEKF